MRSMIKTFLISWVLVVCAGCLVAVKTANADYHDPTAKTNVNEQTDLFDQSIDDWSGLQDQIRDSKETTINGAKSEEGLDYLVKESRSEITTEADSLSSINANDLQDKGTNKMLQENTIDDLYVDFDKPLNKQYMVDAQKIANAQDELIKNLQAVLKDFGVDCKTVKGPKEIEPAYYLQIKKEQTKDTVYNKTLCEELRNKYNCTDTLKLSCKTKVMQWEDWQDRTIDFGGGDIYWNLVGWMYSYKWEDREFGLHIRQEPHVMADIGREIAKRIGATTDQVAYVATIMPPLHPFRLNTPGKGFGEIFHLEKKSYTWEIFKFSYKYREGKLVCGEWDEEWNEECKLRAM